jgi:uncharacterized protein (TIGR02246 family)
MFVSKGTNMHLTTPESLLDAFFKAMNDHDLDGALALYEPPAAFVAEPGRIAEGRPAIREALAGFIGLKPVVTTEKRSIITVSDFALALTRWSLEGTAPDGATIRISGEATDVLRKQSDGSWRVALDNPWGAAILGERVHA